MKKMGEYFYIIGIFLLPFDSVPFLFPSDYRPISVIFFMLHFAFCRFPTLLKNMKFYKAELYLLIFILFNGCIALLFAYFKYRDFQPFLDFFITAFLGYITFSSSIMFFHEMRKKFINNDQFVLDLFRKLIKAYILPVIVGVIQLFAYLGFLPSMISKKITSIFSYHVVDRIQLVTRESAWGVRHLNILMPIYFLYSRWNPKYLLLAFLCLLMIVTSFSMEGYLVFVISLLIFILINYRKNIFTVVKYFSLFSLVLLAVWIALPYIVEIIGVGQSYFGERILKLNQYFWQLILHPMELLYVDGSVFVRTVYPIVGLLQFFHSPVIGVGSGYYYVAFSDYILEYFPKAPKVFDNVYYDVYTAKYVNGKNFYTRLLSETGMVGLMLFVPVIYHCVRKLYQAVFENILVKKALVYILVLLFTMLLQNDSYAYVHLWVFLALVYSLTNGHTASNKKTT